MRATFNPTVAIGGTVSSTYIFVHTHQIPVQASESLVHTGLYLFGLVCTPALQDSDSLDRTLIYVVTLRSDDTGTYLHTSRSRTSASNLFYVPRDGEQLGCAFCIPLIRFVPAWLTSGYAFQFVAYLFQAHPLIFCHVTSNPSSVVPSSIVRSRTATRLPCAAMVPP